MIKTSPREYASALAEITEGLPNEKLPEIVRQFIKLLTLKKDLRLINKIIAHFETIYNQKNNIAHLEIKSARPLPEKTLARIKSIFKKELAQNIETTEITDPLLLGGLLIKHQDTILDLSIAGKLTGLKQSLTK